MIAEYINPGDKIGNETVKSIELFGGLLRLVTDAGVSYLELGQWVELQRPTREAPVESPVELQRFSSAR